MKKIFRKIHLWLSIPFGLIITIICFSGAILVFENEVMQLYRPDLYRVEITGKRPQPIAQLVNKVNETLPDSIFVTGVNISSDPTRSYQVILSNPRRASIYVDQYKGEIKGRHERSTFFTTMFKLHRWLLDSMKPDGGIFTGKIIVGISTLMFIFVLISGIFIWWPRTRRALKSTLKITTNKGWRRFWYDLHVAGGMYAFLFLLAMALTGLTWSFSWYKTGFYKVFGVETPSSGVHRNVSANHSTSTPYVNNTARGNNRKDRKARAENKEAQGKEGYPNHENRKFNPFSNWQQVYEQLKTENTGYQQISISDGSANVSFSGWGNQRAADRYTFNPRNGEITERLFYKDMDNSQKIRGWIFSVHVGNWGGLLTRILTFIAALLGASLPLTGYYLWIKKSIIHSRKRKSNP